MERVIPEPAECYPLGLGYLSSVLALHNISHEGIDLWGSQLSEEQAIEKINFAWFDFIGISAYSTQYKYLKGFTQKLKKHYPQAPIICGGPGPTFSYETILKNTGVDICILREGEVTLVELLESFHDLRNVKGIAYIENGEVMCTVQREPIRNLDTLPLPNRALFDFEKVIEVAGCVRSESQAHNDHPKLRRSADIIAGRECALTPVIIVLRHLRGCV